MQEEMNGRIEITATRNRKGGKPVVTARAGDETLMHRKCDLDEPGERDRLKKEIVDRSDTDPEEIEAELLRLAVALNEEDQDDDGPVDQGEEVDVNPGMVERPELFHRPEVSAIAIPTTRMYQSKGKAETAGHYEHYLQYGDGRREKRPLEPMLPTPAGNTWIHPSPAPPTIRTPVGWSIESRRAWLDGAQPPDPPELFELLCRQIDKYIEFPMSVAQGHIVTMATWTLLSYVYPAWSAVPYLYFGGPAGSGKTTVFNVLREMLFRAFVTSSATGPSVFRTLHDRGGVLLLDEAEQLRRTNDPVIGEMRSVLLAGYKHGAQATRLEKIGDTFRTVHYDVYGPKALACIDGLPPALSSRCIPVDMFRAPPDSPKPRRRIEEDSAVWQHLRDMLHTAALCYGTTWPELAARTDVCPDMHGRDYELWQPPLSIAAWWQDNGVDRLHGLLADHALHIIESAKEDSVPERDAILIQILLRERRATTQPTSKELLMMANEAEPNLFKGWSASSVGRHMKKYALGADHRTGRRREYRIEVERILEVMGRYGIPEEDL